MHGTLYITGDPDADGLLNTDPLALLLGMLLDQQVPMEWAFKGPATLRDRLGRLDAVEIAAIDPEALWGKLTTRNMRYGGNTQERPSSRKLRLR